MRHRNSPPPQTRFCPCGGVVTGAESVSYVEQCDGANAVKRER